MWACRNSAVPKEKFACDAYKETGTVTTQKERERENSEKRETGKGEEKGKWGHVCAFKVAGKVHKNIKKYY